MLESFVALGDSFTEGLDDVRPDGSYRGWADLVAAELARHQPGFRYANLAVRGRRLGQVLAEQVPYAEAVRPSLVTVAAGGNDILGLRCDVPALAAQMHEVLERLVRAADTVVVFAGFDPRGRLPFGQPLARRAEPYNASVVASADQLGAVVVDLWRMPDLYRDRNWAPDRLHLSADGHALVAAAVLRALAPVAGVIDLRDDVIDLRDDPARAPWLAARRADAEWARSYFVPWVGRRLRGRSTGDGREPKLPQLRELADLADRAAEPPCRS